MTNETTSLRDCVFQIADRMFAAGVEPQAKLIREERGSGSLSDFVRHLKTWREERSERTPELSRGCVDAIKLEIARAASSEKESSKKLVGAIQHDLTHCLENLEASENESRSQKGQIAELEEKLREQRAVVCNLHIVNKNQMDTLDQLRDERARRTYDIQAVEHERNEALQKTVELLADLTSTRKALEELTAKHALLTLANARAEVRAEMESDHAMRLYDKVVRRESPPDGVRVVGEDAQQATQAGS